MFNNNQNVIICIKLYREFESADRDLLGGVRGRPLPPLAWPSRPLLLIGDADRLRDL